MMILKKKLTMAIPLLILLVAVQSISSAATNEPAFQNDLKSPPVYPHKENAEVFTKRSLSRDCENTYSPTCLKLDIVSFIEKMSESKDFSILPGLSVVKESDANQTKTSEIVAELARSFPNDPEKRLDSFLMYKLNSYLDSHALRLKLVEDGSVEKLGEGRKGGGGFGGGGGGGGGGKKGGYGGLMAAALMMKGTLGALGMGALAMLAGKALMTALMSLMLSAIIGLKSLTSGGGKSTTYEIVTKPVYSHAQSHSSSHEDVHAGGGYGHSGYGRSFNIELPKHLQTPSQ